MKKKNKFKEVQEHKGYKIGDVIHIQRWYHGEDTPQFHDMGNSLMVDVKVPIIKITIDEETGKDTLWCQGNCSTSVTDIANKGIVEYSKPFSIEEFIITLMNKKIPVRGVSLIEDLNVLGYEVPGFSKSGHVTLFESKGKIFASARYNETTEISSFDDLVSLAWDWYIRYKDRSPFENPDSIWTPYFIEKGWIKKVMKYEYEIVK